MHGIRMQSLILAFEMPYITLKICLAFMVKRFISPSSRHEHTRGEAGAGKGRGKNQGAARIRRGSGPRFVPQPPTPREGA